jgi:hypothetical protein
LTAKHYNIPGTRCPTCGKDADGAASINNPERPHPGAYSLCLYCGGVHIYTSGLKLRKAEVADLAKLSPHDIQELARTRARLLSFTRPYPKA